MPVLEATDTQFPRSALRHRPLAGAYQQSIVTTATHPAIQRASRTRPRSAADELVSEWQIGDSIDTPNDSSQPSPKAVVRHERSHPAPKARATSRSQARQATGLRAHPLLLLALGMIAVLVVWTLLHAGLNWWTNAMDYVHYGYPRTYQVDAVVGHNDSTNNPSHFVATNLHGHIEIIEFPGGDGTHARIYLGPQLFGPDADKTPVTLQFADVNADHKPDMLIFFQSSWFVLINDQDSFRAPTSQEHQEAVSYLKAHGQSS